LDLSQDLEDFDINKFLNIRTLFSNKNFIELDIDTIKELDL